MSNMNSYQEFVTNYVKFKYAKQYHPEVTMDVGGTPETFIKNIDHSIHNAKVFEISDDVKKLLLLTNTPAMKENKDLHLPYEYMFIDVDFTKEELAELGINIKEESICGIFFSIGNLVNDDKMKQLQVNAGISLRFTSMYRGNGEVWFNTLYHPLWIHPDYAHFNVKEVGVVKKSTKNVIYNFIINFLNFVNNPEVQYVEHIRDSQSNARRIKKGKMALPSSTVVNVNGQLKVYIDQIASHTKFHCNYRYWVRGHFRTLRDARYGENVGKRIWLLPYIRGEGLLVNKTYKIEEKNE
jgi:hypothetical protein